MNGHDAVGYVAAAAFVVASLIDLGAAWERQREHRTITVEQGGSLGDRQSTNGRSIGALFDFTHDGDASRFPMSPNDPLIESINRKHEIHRVWFEADKLCWQTPKVKRRCVAGTATR